MVKKFITWLYVKVVYLPDLRAKIESGEIVIEEQPLDVVWTPSQEFIDEVERKYIEIESRLSTKH